MIESGRRQSPKQLLTVYLVLVLFLITISFPAYWMVLTSLRQEIQIYNSDSMLAPTNLTLENYRHLFEKTNFALWMRNSAAVSLGSTILALAISVLAAYGLSRLRFFGRKAISWLVLFAYIIPRALLFIPMFIEMHQLNLLNSLWGLFLSYQSFNVPFCTWLLIGYFRTLPRELEDAAMIDGCGRMGVLGRIVMPLAGPGIATAAIFAFLNSWNEFLYANIFIINVELRTVTVGLAGFQVQDVFLWGPMMAGSFLASIPMIILFMFIQRYVVEGLTLGAVKG